MKFNSIARDATMGRHKEWRKLAKRERRRRIRKEIAQKRDSIYDDEEYVKELDLLEKMEIEKIERMNAEENEKWIRAETIEIRRWEKLQEHLKNVEKQELAKKAKLKLEWELEQKKVKEEAERLKAIEEEKKQRHERFMKHLEEFLSGSATEPPEELFTIRETRPRAETCSFFSKTGCCRFGDECSRNHKYPGISRILLATNFFAHFGLENSTLQYNEYDTDIMLEYDDTETHKQYEDFFYDVLPEFEKFGKIVQFKVCNNHSKHLRGNTYVEYSELRGAVAAYRALHSRWYGGRVLSLQFCNINSWTGAICGLQAGRRCPKGHACNFLHVFRNPKNMFANRYDYTPSRERDRNERSKRSSPSRWRWSESPEVEIVRKSIDREHSRKRREKENERWRESRHRSRSKSRQRSARH